MVRTEQGEKLWVIAINKGNTVDPWTMWWLEAVTPHSRRSAHNSRVGPLYPQFCTRGFNQAQIV